MYGYIRDLEGSFYRFGFSLRLYKRTGDRGPVPGPRSPVPGPSAISRNVSRRFSFGLLVTFPKRVDCEHRGVIASAIVTVAIIRHADTPFLSPDVTTF